MSDAPARHPEIQTWLRRKSGWSVYEIAFWLCTLIPFFFFPTYLTLFSQIAIWALFAISVDLILGYAGIVTLGHAMFFGIGAYTAGLLTKAGLTEPVVGLVAAAALAAFIGYLTSFLIVRVQHLTLIMITLGLGFLTLELANAMTWLTGGADGLRGVNVGPILGMFEFDLWGYSAYGYALALLFLGVVFSRRLVHSPFGLTLRGIRENTHRMPAIGAPYRLHLRKIFTVSAAMAGVAGAILTHTTSTVSLETLSFLRSADVVVMLILGGTGRLYGAIIGAMIFLLARDQLSGLNPQYWYFWIGILLMVVVLVMPRGILGGLARLTGRREP